MNAIPEYLRIVDDIAERIRTGELRPGERLPPYRILAETYDVSVSTIQSALRILRERKLIKGRRGKGTYVADRRETD